MQCQNCSQETNGIRINNKLFCTNCGEPLDATEPPVQNETIDTTVVPQIPVKSENNVGTPAPKFIPAEKSLVDYNKIVDDEEREIDILRAEKEVVEAIESIPQTEAAPKAPVTTEPKKVKVRLPKTKRKIVKHNRQRTGFAVIAGEPDPINDPELPIPHDDMIENLGTDIAQADAKPLEVNFVLNKDDNFPLATKEEDRVYKEKETAKGEALRGFFKAGLVETSRKKKAATKAPKKNVFLVVFASIILLAFVGFSGLVLYVNLVGNNTGRAVKKAEAKVSFLYTKPSYTPPGYKISYLTNSDSKNINYVYLYAPNEKLSLNIKINGDNWTEEKLVKDALPKTLDQFTQQKIKGNSVWLFANRNLFFVKNGILYEISSSDTISSVEMLRIAEGMI